MWKRILLRGALGLALFLAAFAAWLALGDHLYEKDAVVRHMLSGFENEAQGDDLAEAVQRLGDHQEEIRAAAAGDSSLWRLLRPEHAELTRRCLMAVYACEGALSRFAQVEAETDALLERMRALKKGQNIMIGLRDSADAVSWERLRDTARRCGNTDRRLRLLAGAAGRYRAAVAEIRQGLVSGGLASPDPEAGQARMEALLHGRWVRERAALAAELFGIRERGDASLAEVNGDIRKELERIVEEYRGKAATQGTSLE